MTKSNPFDHPVETVLALPVGQAVMGERSRTDLLRELARARRAEAQRLSPFSSLTPKEREVLVALFHGATVETITGQWVVSEATVRSHGAGGLTKRGVSSQLAGDGQSAAGGPGRVSGGFRYPDMTRRTSRRWSA